MADSKDARRQKILLAILGVLVVVFVARMVLSGGGDDSSGGASTTSTATPVAGATTTTSTATTSTTSDGSLPPDTFDVYSTRNPFEPAFQETPATDPWTAPGLDGFGTTSATDGFGTTPATDGFGTATTGEDGTTASSGPSYNPPQGATVALLDVYLDGTTVMSRVQVGSTVYTVAAGDLFGPSSGYRVVSLDEPCGQFLYGDSPFELCEGQQVIK